MSTFFVQIGLTFFTVRSASAAEDYITEGTVFVHARLNWRASAVTGTRGVQKGRIFCKFPHILQETGHGLTRIFGALVTVEHFGFIIG